MMRFDGQLPPPKARWIIRGTLTTLTPLHIGSGQTGRHDGEGARNESPENARLCLRDHEGRPFIPASSLKGCLRAYLEGCGAVRASVPALFGEFPKEGEEEGPRPGWVEFRHCWLAGRVPEGKLPQRDSHGIALETSVALDSDTRTAVDRKLFGTEIVPPGCGFDVELVADVPTGEREKELLRDLLSALRDAFPSDGSVGLGADTAKGRGRLAWKLAENGVKKLGKSEWSKWWTQVRSASNGSPVPDWHSFAVEASLLPAEGPIRPADRRLRIEIELCFDSPFLVNEPPHRGDQDGSPAGEPDFTPRLDHAGRPVLPARSFHGAFRAQAERILRTLGCEVTPGHEVGAAAIRGCWPIAFGKKSAKSEPAAMLFGAPGWRTVIDATGFVWQRDAGGGSLFAQEFVAIDRFDGGAAEKAKFNGRSCLCPVLVGTLSVDPLRVNPWGYGLLALVLRDLMEGDIAFGFGRNKGYGNCTARVTRINGRPTKDWLASEWATWREESRIHWGGAQPGDESWSSWLCTAVNALHAHLGINTRLSGATSATSPSTSREMAIDRNVITKGQTPSGQSTVQIGEDFHNPYHFVRVDAPDVTKWLSRTDFEAGNLGHHSHARYASGALDGQEVFSGRLLCSLTTRTPLVVGSQQESASGESRATAVSPFLLGGEPAIPATSLKGMVTSIAEAASGSALRVLERKILSYRRDMKESLSAVGMILATGSGARRKYSLLPLAMPTLVLDEQKQAYYPQDHCDYSRMFPDPRLKVYLNRMAARLDRRDSFSVGKEEMFYLPLAIDGFRMNADGGLQKVGPLRHPQGGRGVQFVIGQCPASGNGTILDADELKSMEERGEDVRPYVPGLLRIMYTADREDKFPRTRKHELFIPFPDAWDKWTRFPIEPAAVARFIELAAERRKAQKKAIESGEVSRDLRLPYVPRGTRGNPGRDADQDWPGLRTGDLVFFRPNAEGTAVAEISFSSIWRGRVEYADQSTSFGPLPPTVGADSPWAKLATLNEVRGSHAAEKELATPRKTPGNAADMWDFFAETDPELLPFNSDRKYVSPAEMLFGFVENRESGTKKTPRSGQGQALAFAGKVRFSFGRLGLHQGDVFGEQITLKIMSSPKPPSPALYFEPRRNASDNYVTKRALNPGAHRPRGRKFYLHAWRDAEDRVVPFTAHGLTKTQPEGHGSGPRPPWETAHFEDETDNQKMSVRPINSGTTFYFHLDFDNLSRRELGLLSYALAPTAKFEHKLGLGKPLGLGSVKIQPCGLFLVDRVERYRSPWTGLTHARFDTAWVASELRGDTLPQPIPGASSDSYDCVKTALGGDWPAAPDVGTLGWEWRREAEKGHGDVLAALELIGNPRAVVAPVHYPQVKNDSSARQTLADLEQDTYRWFVANDSGSGRRREGTRLSEKREAMPPLVERAEHLPLLKRHEWHGSDEE